MNLTIDVRLEYQVDNATDALLQIEAAPNAQQRIIHAHIEVNGTREFTRVPAEDEVGERIWLQAIGHLDCHYTAQMAINRPDSDIATLEATPPHDLPGDVVRYILPSRYCPAEAFVSFVDSEFEGLTGGARIAAITDWIAQKFEYVAGVSDGRTTALESFVERRGVCRDYAHVLIALARASTIPARFVSAYAPNVTPPDFHAVAEVFLDGAWHLVDATGMAKPSELAVIGVGLDATSVAFLTTFGPAEFVSQSVSVHRA